MTSKITSFIFGVTQNSLELADSFDILKLVIG